MLILYVSFLDVTKHTDVSMSVGHLILDVPPRSTVYDVSVHGILDTMTMTILYNIGCTKYQTIHNLTGRATTATTAAATTTGGGTNVRISRKDHQRLRTWRCVEGSSHVTY